MCDNWGEDLKCEISEIMAVATLTSLQADTFGVKCAPRHSGSPLPNNIALGSGDLPGRHYDLAERIRRTQLAAGSRKRRYIRNNKIGHVLKGHSACLLSIFCSLLSAMSIVTIAV